MLRIKLLVRGYTSCFECYGSGEHFHNRQSAHYSQAAREDEQIRQLTWTGSFSLSDELVSLPLSTDSFRPDRPGRHQLHLFGELETFSSRLNTNCKTTRYCQQCQLQGTRVELIKLFVFLTSLPVRWRSSTGARTPVSRQILESKQTIKDH